MPSMTDWRRYGSLGTMVPIIIGHITDNLHDPASRRGALVRSLPAID